MVTKDIKQADLYTYRWSPEDEEFVGPWVEFPGLSWRSLSREDAFKAIYNLVQDIIKDMASSGEPAPEPLVTKHFSGKFTVRVTADQHRKLAIKDAESMTSLNRSIADYLLD